jgi:hypothetical protein
MSNWIRQDENPAPEVTERLTAFWEFRTAAVSAGADPKELAEFGWWFASGHFEAEWSLGRLLHAIETVGYVEAVDEALDRLGELSRSHLLLCLDITSAWIAQRPRNFYPVERREQALRRLVRAGLAGGNDECHVAEDLKGQLIGIGFDLRDETGPHPEDDKG